MLSSSLETLGPTTSVLTNRTLPSDWVSLASTRLTVALMSAPLGAWKRTRAEDGAPTGCTCTSPMPMPPKAARTLPKSTAAGAVEISITVPPLKSMPQARPPHGGLNG